jgi:ribosomal-protein-serine acetyltransferase
VFGYELGENTELRLLEERHAEQLADLTDRNREHLRTWLPWVDASRTVEDGKNFIRSTVKQFAENNGFQAGIWHEGRLAGVVGHHAIDWEHHSTSLGRVWGLPVPGKHEEVSSDDINQATEGEAI